MDGAETDPTIAGWASDAMLSTVSRALLGLVAYA
jgi:hypothetical protein